MKRIKKFVSMILAVVMVLGMSLTVFADGDQWKITVKLNSADKTVHTYEAYQIFRGDLVDGKLSNIDWGTGVNGSELLDALKGESSFVVKNAEGADVNLFNSCTSAADVANVLAGNEFTDSTEDTTTLTDTFARLVEANLTQIVAGTGTNGKEDTDGSLVVDETKSSVEITVNGSGYYLIKDKDGSVNTTSGAYSRFMLEVVGNVEATVKSEVPHGTKEVYTDAAITGDANYASIGSHVSYKIVSNVPNYVGYNYYYFIMNDTLDEGLTFDGKNSVTVTVDGTTLEQGKDYYVYDITDVEEATEDDPGFSLGGKTFRLAFKNIMEKTKVEVTDPETGNVTETEEYKYAVGDEIVVTYSATVNDKAKVGVEGNENAWTLQYSNNPDDTFGGNGGPGDNEDHPGLPVDEDHESLGETPRDITLTYLTKLDITKYANSIDGNPLADAEFTLTGTSYQVVLNTVDYYRLPKENEDGTWYLLKDGTYTETPPTATKYEPIAGVGTETIGTSTTTTGYIKVEEEGEEKYIIPENRNEYVGQPLYKMVHGTEGNYVDVKTKYYKDKAQTTERVAVDVSMKVTTGADGKINFNGLGEGSYVLTETVTPAGYNTIDPMKFTITWVAPSGDVTEGNEECSWKISAVEGITFNAPEGSSFAYDDYGVAVIPGGTLDASIVNVSGALLPSTGGIGTTIFYVVGGLMVFAAVVLLVTKKRMSAEKK